MILKPNFGGGEGRGAHIFLSLFLLLFDMSTGNSYEDKHTEEFFREIENDKKQHYEKCSVIDAFDNLFNCYSKILE